MNNDSTLSIPASKMTFPLNRLIIDAVCNASPLARLAQPTEHHSSLSLSFHPSSNNSLSLEIRRSWCKKVTTRDGPGCSEIFEVRQHHSLFACARVFPRPCACLLYSPRCSRRVKSLIDTSACADSEDRPRDGRSEPRRCKSLQFNHSLLKPVYNWAMASCCPWTWTENTLFKQMLPPIFSRLQYLEIGIFYKNYLILKGLNAGSGFLVGGAGVTAQEHRY